MKTTTGREDFGTPQPLIKGLAIVMLVTSAILLVPLLAMQFSAEVDWNLTDFVIAGGLIALTGSLYVLAARVVTQTRYRAMVGAVLAILFVLTWAELAVGLFGTRFAGS
jgi:hypothetical protein